MPLSGKTWRGFTLIEIMIALAILALLLAIAVPFFGKMRESARNTRVANDFRIFAEAFQTHALDHGEWPANVGAGVIPPGLERALSKQAWQAITPIGGRWNWDANAHGITAGVSISGFTCTERQLIALDLRIDDGDLSTGLLRRTESDRITFVIEP